MGIDAVADSGFAATHARFFDTATGLERLQVAVVLQDGGVVLAGALA